MALCDIRKLGINPNHWYVVARSLELQTQPLSVMLWHQPIVLYRGQGGKVWALADRCPHRQVKLSHGRVVGDRLQCAYHGWCFDSTGQCVAVPYMMEQQKLPHCTVQTYPVKEQDGFIWLFPGDSQKAERAEILGLPEWNDIDYIGSVSIIDCAAHFSYIIENLVDLYHGHLHQQQQVWEDPVLEELKESGDRVDVFYQGQIYYQIDKIWSIAQLFIPAMRRLRPSSFQMSYVYPHWMQALGEEFKLYCLLCPISETSTRAYLVHFTSLKHLHRVQKLSPSIRQFMNDRLFGVAQKYLDILVRQDIQMMEEEQQAYLHHPERKNHELNPAVLSIQRLIQNQATQAMPVQQI